MPHPTGLTPRVGSWRLRLGGILLLGSLLCAPPCAAKPSGQLSPRTEQARQEVLTALSVGNPGHAEEILDRAFRAEPDPSLLYQLGLVAQAQGRSIAALDLYRRYQELVGPAVSAENAAAIETFAASTTASYTALNVTASPGMLLCVDDKIVGMLPLPSPLLLAGGTHRFRIERRNEHYETGTLPIADGREADLRLTPGAAGKAVAVLSLSPITLLVLQPKSMQAASAQAVAVQRALAEAARKNHLAPLPQSRLALLLAKREAGCLEQRDCQFAVAEQAQARAVLRALVLSKEETTGDAASSPANCLVQLEYLDVNAGQVAAAGATDTIPCSGPPLAEALSAVIERLVTQTNGRTRGMVSISSVPDGAQVRVDGLLRGATPYLRASFAGQHEVLVEKDNFYPFKTRVEVAVGQVAAAQAPLTAMPEQEREPPPAPLRVPKLVFVDHQNPRPRWRLALGGVALGAGVFLGGVGIAALSVNGQCSQGPENGGVCDSTYATSALGGGLLGTGLVLVAAGAVLVGLPGSRERLSGTILAEP